MLVFRGDILLPTYGVSILESEYPAILQNAYENSQKGKKFQKFVLKNFFG